MSRRSKIGMFDLTITGGCLIDGGGGPTRMLDIGVRGDRVVAVEDLSDAESRLTIDGSGCVVCPGFIDVHSHSDAYLLIEPSAASKIFQGVTTEVIGNCGCSGAPRGAKARMPSDWNEFEYPGRWSSLADYRELFANARPAVNAAMLVGHNNLRASVMGYENRHASVDEMNAMTRLLEESLDNGAIGLSTGLLYSPGMFAARAEVLALVSVVARYGGIYTSHMRSESAELLEALDETIAVGREAGCRVEISHIKTAGIGNWHKIDALLDRVRVARASGVSVAADRYPYLAACTDLDVILPGWAAAGERSEILARLSDSTSRKRIREELLVNRPADYWGRVMIGSTWHSENRRFSGMRLDAVADELDMEPVDAALRLMESDELHTGGIFFGMCEENLLRILREPWVMIGSDASLRAPTGPLSNDHPHPRGYGAFTRFLRMAADGATVELSEAVRKMTSLPAAHFQIEGRGLLCPGNYADIAVIDFDRLRENSTYAKPHQLSDGVDALIVNGSPTILNGVITGERNGLFLS